ncbi:MAG: hypothetical protein FJ405_04010 [Verrucomicrobia bacterium]|nr:hypothetical protein [Verrucomicrobiota bacterium]
MNPPSFFQRCYEIHFRLVTAMLGIGLGVGSACSLFAAATPKTYEVKGIIREVDAPARQVRILHDEIPGYMKKMVMLFDVKDASDLKALSVGDSVKFRMLVTEDDGWIEKLEKTGSAAAVGTPAPKPALFLPTTVLKVGDPLPALTFTNQLGEPVTLQDRKGQVLVFTFIFTTCPFPTMCPRMTSNFKQTIPLVTSNTTEVTRSHFYSISIDPTNDTPAVLTRYAEGQGASPASWTFLTGDEQSIGRLARGVGLNYMREGGLLNHNLRTVVVDKQGKIFKILTGNEWKPVDLAGAIREAEALKH